jgi:hypothetical protein
MVQGLRQPAEAANATRTWLFKDGEWHVRFCSMSRMSRPGGFLLPYNSENELKATPREIQRCVRFNNSCPSIPFAVRGQTVKGRRVLVHKSAEKPESYTRDYCSLDSARCGAFGYLVGENCARARAATKCVLDRFASPLVDIVFRPDGGDVNDYTSDEALLLALRRHCKYAFSKKIAGMDNAELLSEMRATLLSPYSSTDAEALAGVSSMANALVFAVFGVGADRTLDHGRGLSRGADSSLDVYVEQAKCARYLAEHMKKAEKRFGGPAAGKVSYYIDEARYSSPGSSLYLFSERVAVFVPLRWLMQCVVWAKDDGQGQAAWEGGVHKEWAARVLAGKMDGDAASCANWDWRQPAAESHVTLKKRLLTARRVFTVVESDDDNVWSINTIANDVDTAVFWALDQLGARSWPDLWCVALNANSSVSQAQTLQDVLEDGQQNVRFSSNIVIRTPLLPLDVTLADYEDGISRLVDNDLQTAFSAETLSVMKMVRTWLVGDIPGGEWTTVTLKQLIDIKAVKTRDEDLTDLVRAIETHWSMYEFTKLEDVAFRSREFDVRRNVTYEEYVSQQACPGLPAAKLLREPEFTVKGEAFTKCAQPGQLYALTCETLQAGVEGYYERRDKSQAFLRKQELLFLVLVLVQRALHDSVTGGLGALHLPRLGWTDVNDLFTDTAAGQAADPLDLVAVRSVNDIMRRLSESAVECRTDSEIDFRETTNLQHFQLGECLTELREELGWVIPAKDSVFGAFTIEIPVNARTLLDGFYPAFVEKLREEDVEAPTGVNAHLYRGEYFLRDLTKSFGSLDSRYEERVCFASEDSMILEDNRQVRMMHPFWGEFFDVAHEGSAVLKRGMVARGCDMKRSGPDNSILVFSTLCGETPGGDEEVCARHPHYIDAVRSQLPEACEELDGADVHRGRLGAMSGAPLCEREPDTGDPECRLSHGLLHGKLGARAGDLDAAAEVGATQQGLWNRSNTLFRAREDPAAPELSQEATALRLFEHDIGGHVLHFRVNAAGVLRLQSVFMQSDPAPGAQADVGDWLARAEEDFAEQHVLYEFVHKVAEARDVSWRCPLHWLQTFVSDGGYDQARVPVAARNEARFEHITGSGSRFAHPTVRHSSKIPNLQAAHFLSDGLACVGSAGDCHGREWLDRSIDSLLRRQDEWQVVEYVGEETCARVLDWPEADNPGAARL